MSPPPHVACVKLLKTSLPFLLCDFCQPSAVWAHKGTRVIGSAPGSRHRSTAQKAEICDSHIFLISEVSCILIPFASPRQEKTRKDGHFTGYKKHQLSLLKKGMLFPVE